MKKTYFAPEINVTRINPAVLNESMSGGGCGTNGANAQSIRLFDEEDYDDDFASDF